jgi:hypothetical protein
MSALFIVGAPRSGSTLLYQTITNSLDVLYPDNLTSLFGRRLYTGLAWSRRLFGPRAHNCFRSTRGRTWRCGLHAPNELEHVFTRAFPDGYARGAVTAELHDIAAETRRAQSVFGRAVVFKALRVGQHLAAAVAALAESRFLFIRRDPIQTVQSILLARQEECADPAAPWYVVPREVEELDGLAGTAMIVRQVYLIEREITRELAALPMSHHATVWYHDLCDNLPDTVEMLRPLLPATRFRRDHLTPNSVPQRRSLRMSATGFDDLRRLVDELDWTFSE